VLIADEPTSALDVSVQAQVLDIIDDLVATRGHGPHLHQPRSRPGRRYCDRILVMNRGEIVEECAAGRLAQRSTPTRAASSPPAAHR
jgi:peptide/nickel transport system ATP-binding protein